VEAEEQEEPTNESCSHIYATPNRRVIVTLSSHKATRHQVQKPVLLDSGCTANLLGKPTSDSLNTKLQDASKVKLYNASGEEMEVSGNVNSR
jgi:hypothetical protein